MWNWITSPQNLRLAWARVAHNRGARSAGVDGRTVKNIESREGSKRFLEDLRGRLRSGGYAPSPVRRVLIPKRGKPGQFRPLGVPTVEDRLVQAAILHLLEPIYEAMFYNTSYGFRPKRSCRDALQHIRCAIEPGKGKGIKPGLPPSYQWVIEGDIKACFDHIDHHSVMERLRRRISDVKVLRLVGAFLKAGILCENAFLRSDAGTPQGGILSPLLANIVLTAIEERYSRHVAPPNRPGAGPTCRRTYDRARGRPVFFPVRYADDFVVLVAGQQQHALDEKEALARYLSDTLKLSLSDEKTRVTSLTEGFQFLGHRVRIRWSNRMGHWPRLEIPKEKISDLRYRVKQITRMDRTHQPLQAVIDDLNPLLRGWGYFYRHCYDAKRIFSSLDFYVWQRVLHWLRKKHPTTSPALLCRRYWRRHGRGSSRDWIDARPLARLYHIPTGPHSLQDRHRPRYAWVSESPVHNERCTPGSGTGVRETAAGNRSNAP